MTTTMQLSSLGIVALAALCAMLMRDRPAAASAQEGSPRSTALADPAPGLAV